MADAGDDLYGHLAIELMEKPETAFRKPHTEGHIHHISVDPAAHRTSVGRALAKHAIAAPGADRITAGYWTFNKPSEVLFCSVGFQLAVFALCLGTRVRSLSGGIVDIVVGRPCLGLKRPE